MSTLNHAHVWGPWNTEGVTLERCDLCRAHKATPDLATVLALLSRIKVERARADAAEAEARSENERRIENNSAAWCERDAARTECERLRAALEKIMCGGMPIGSNVNALEHILAMCGIAAETLHFKETK